LAQCKNGRNGWGSSSQKGKEITLRNKIKKDYKEKTDILFAASQLWVDAVIDPIETRVWISMGIEIANQSPSKEKFNMGILQV
jgi:3-methylcrotonyl-CoA carboxylase beta subunit